MANSDSNNPQEDKKPGKQSPDFSREQELIEAGYNRVAGVDEAGRGPLAGPVVVAALILDPKNIPEGLNDSKKLSAKKRQKLFEELILVADFSVVCAPPPIIEKLNIRGATLWAMKKAVERLSRRADFALIDGRDIPQNIPCKSRAVIGGDRLSLSIGAASIIAKVTRDQMCPIMDVSCPGYEFAKHKGYGTKAHMDQLRQFGVTKFHRPDFAPVTALIKPAP
ncbi:MAG: ribonuclease HII [Devosiaceae bacterium]|nr:ribonuclease HII [Devosiaceae bacterium]